MYCSEHYVHLQKNRSTEKFDFTTFVEPNSYSFQASGLILVPKEAEFSMCSTKKYRIFSQILNSKKSRSLAFVS